MTRSPRPCRSDARSSASGVNVSLSNACRASTSAPGPVAPGFFPPEVVVQVKALACELPATRGLPLSRFSTVDLVREVERCGIVASISNKTVWRWLHDDAIRPWRCRSWIFPRDPEFATKAGRILDLYARQWKATPLQTNEFVISADEKTSIQARIRTHATTPPGPRRVSRVEHEYTRGGAWAYLAALDVVTPCAVAWLWRPVPPQDSLLTRLDPGRHWPPYTEGHCSHLKRRLYELTG